MMDVLEVSSWTPYAFIITTFILGLSVLAYLGVQYDKSQQRKSTIGIKDEPSEIEPEFKNLPNFRQAGGSGLRNKHGRKVRDGLLYRSSRTDFLNEDETRQIRDLGIKSIIDLRRNQEYAEADGSKILDKTFKLCIVKNGVIKDWKQPKRQESSSQSNDYCGQRYLVNIMTKKLILQVFNKVNIVIRILSLAPLAVDRVFGSHLFVRLFSYLISNRQTLADQYMAIVEHTKQEISSTLRLLLEDRNVPVLIHCAHGKDRTGVIVALILGCLEVDDDIIAQDYSKSEAGLAPIKERLYRETVGKYGFKAEFTRATADTMMTVLSTIHDKYGSIPEYLETTGFTSEEQQKLKSIFLE